MSGEPEFAGVSGLDLSSLSALLLSGAKVFSVVTIHPEIDDPGVCFIGKVASMGEGELELLEVTPDGEWENETDSYKLSSITRVDFGGLYEEALVMVADAG